MFRGVYCTYICTYRSGITMHIMYVVHDVHSMDARGPGNAHANDQAPEGRGSDQRPEQGELGAF